jgi:hypothetical protein
MWWETRKLFWKGMHTNSIFKVAALIWGLFSITSLFLPFFPKASEEIYGARYLSHLPWSVIVIGFLVIAFIAIFEGGLKQVQNLKIDHAIQIEAEKAKNQKPRFDGRIREALIGMVRYQDTENRGTVTRPNDSIVVLRIAYPSATNLEL